MNRNLLGIIITLGIGMALMVGLAIYGSRPAQSQTLPATSEMLADRVLGDPNAPVTILDFSSMTCPHCANFHTNTLPRLKEAYIDTGKVKLIFRDFPFDQNALRAAMLARCAPADRYYPLLDVLFKSQAKWATAKDPVQALGQYAKLSGMSQASIDACLANEDLANGILQMRMDAERDHKVSSTPTFVLNDGAEVVRGAESFENFSKALDRLVK